MVNIPTATILLPQLVTQICHSFKPYIVRSFRLSYSHSHVSDVGKGAWCLYRIQALVDTRLRSLTPSVPPPEVQMKLLYSESMLPSQLRTRVGSQKHLERSQPPFHLPTLSSQISYHHEIYWSFSNVPLSCYHLHTHVRQQRRHFFAVTQHVMLTHLCQSQLLFTSVYSHKWWFTKEHFKWLRFTLALVGITDETSITKMFSKSCEPLCKSQFFHNFPFPCMVFPMCGKSGNLAIHRLRHPEYTGK